MGKNWPLGMGAAVLAVNLAGFVVVLRDHALRVIEDMGGSGDVDACVCGIVGHVEGEGCAVIIALLPML